jgi:hypothetical protein
MIDVLSEACGAEVRPIPWVAAANTDSDVDLLALPFVPGPELPALIRRLGALRAGQSGGDLLFLPP